MPDFTVIYPTGSTLYVIAERLSDGSSHIIALADNDDGTYSNDMPAAAGLGQYICRAYKQLGESADTDSDILLYPGETRIWSGLAWGIDDAVHAAMGTYKSSIMTFSGLRSGN